MEKPRSSTKDTSRGISRLDHKIRSSDDRLMRGSVRHQMLDPQPPIPHGKLTLPARMLKYFDVDIPNGYVTLPQQISKHTPHRWLVELRGLNNATSVMRLEIAGDVVLGIKRGDDAPPDLDFTAYGGYLKGVSRRHAMLRPSRSRLYLIDLDSSNGTRINTLKVSHAAAKEIHDQDTISLGALSFTVAIIRKPA